MCAVEAHAALAAGPDRVRECLAKPTRWNEWLTLHKSRKGEPPAAVEGQAATATATAINMPITIDWTLAGGARAWPMPFRAGDKVVFGCSGDVAQGAVMVSVPSGLGCDRGS